MDLTNEMRPAGADAALQEETPLFGDSNASAQTDGQLSQLHELLRELEAPPTAPRAPSNALTRDQQNELALVRLGVAAGLFAALRAKDEHTAKHSLRVALTASAWAVKIGLSNQQRDELEVAALLHDIGKLSIPDAILLKPEPLTEQESAMMDAHWDMGQDILRCCCASSSILETASYARSWYDGSQGNLEQAGDAIPFGARMLAIADAFDSMVTEHVYRRAMSVERAFEDLYAGAGTQFDPALVMLFIKMHEADQLEVGSEAMRRWLRDLHPETSNAHWRRAESNFAAHGARNGSSLFEQKLLENMYDAVIFLDGQLRITEWNRAAERMTGLSSESVLNLLWTPSLMKLRDEQSRLVRDADCPVTHAMRTGVQWLRRLSFRGRSSRQVIVDAHAVPVIGPNGTSLGMVISLHDVSPEITLEQRCQNLHEQATRDALTQVANRAEFDRTLGPFVEAHLEDQRPCSLIICDIDRFKSVNDTYGHQAGDEVIQSFGRVLQSLCRQGDLVARYGGEEFVVLCAECDIAAAARRAEELRAKFAETPQAALDGRAVTASFGCTEVQPGDAPETVLRRADRALLIAKETGRNRVVQLGAGGAASEESEAAEIRQRGGQLLVSQDLITQSPIDRTIEKLRGFVDDQSGEVLSRVENNVLLRIGGSSFFRRASDVPVSLLVDLQFSEESSASDAGQRAGLRRTRIHVEIRPQRKRDRRKASSLDAARQLLMSLRSYLMASDAAPKVEAHLEAEPGLFDLAARFLMPWAAKPPVDDR